MTLGASLPGKYSPRGDAHRLGTSICSRATSNPSRPPSSAGTAGCEHCAALPPPRRTAPWVAHGLPPPAPPPSRRCACRKHETLSALRRRSPWRCATHGTAAACPAASRTRSQSRRLCWSPPPRHAARARRRMPPTGRRTPTSERRPGRCFARAKQRQRGRLGECHSGTALGGLRSLAKPDWAAPVRRGSGKRQCPCDVAVPADPPWGFVGMGV